MKQKPLSQFLDVDTSQERLSRIWARVQPQLEQAQQEQLEQATAGVAARGPLALWRRWWRSAKHSAASQYATATAPRPWFTHWSVPGALVLSAVCGLALVSKPWLEAQLRPTTQVSAWQGAALETAGDALNVALEDGSQLELSAVTRLHIDETPAPNAGSGESQVAVRLAKGKVRCTVTPNPKRRFVVLAQGVEVRVTGTSFSVEVSPELQQVKVQVTSGTVEVAPPGGGGQVRRLSKGEAWAIDLRQLEAQPTEHAAAAASSVVQDNAQGNAEAESEHGLVPGGNARTEPQQRLSQDAARDKTGTQEKSAAFGARELLDRANTARRAGNILQAAQDYEALLASFPSDGRAGLAAFELGRLRMDRLGDVKGAVTALRRAVDLAPGSGFREDAMARLVQAYANMGASAACRSAKQAYLNEYPKGVHASAVTRRCE